MARLQNTDAGVLLHEAFCRQLDVALCFDQLHAGVLARCEVGVRQIQMVEDHWKDKVYGSLVGATADPLLFSGLTAWGLLCICPNLAAWIADAVRTDASFMGERRKVRYKGAQIAPKVERHAAILPVESTTIEAAWKLLS